MCPRLEVVVCMCKSAVSSTCGIFLECLILTALFHRLSVEDLDQVRLLTVFFLDIRNQVSPQLWSLSSARSLYNLTADLIVKLRFFFFSLL